MRMLDFAPPNVLIYCYISFTISICLGNAHSKKVDINIVTNLNII